MSYADGRRVMARVEYMIKNIYLHFSKPGGPLEKSLPGSPFIQMTYEGAMSQHGSDKPDLRIKGLVGDLNSMLRIYN